MNAIGMRDLQKISATTLASLPHTVPIKSGSQTVALLIPIKRPSQDHVARVMGLVDEAAAKRTAKDQAEIAAMLNEEP